MTMETVSKPKEAATSANPMDDIALALRQREAFRILLISAVISEVIAAAGEEAALKFAKDYTLPEGVELLPWATDAITVLGLRGSETLQ
jgi:hypothetical protein